MLATTYYIDSNLPLGDCIFYANNRRRNGEDRLSKIKDLPYAVGGPWSVAEAAATREICQRNIGAGFFTEWGVMSDYADTGLINHYFGASDIYNNKSYAVGSTAGSVTSRYSRNYGVCVYP